jgi:hypothetical protein
VEEQNYPNEKEKNTKKRRRNTWAGRVHILGLYHNTF